MQRETSDPRVPLLTGGPQRVMGPCACGPRPAVGRTESEKAVRLSFLLQCSTLGRVWFRVKNFSPYFDQKFRVANEV